MRAQRASRAISASVMDTRFVQVVAIEESASSAALTPTARIFA
jgi:hypothetical protein